MHFKEGKLTRPYSSKRPTRMIFLWVQVYVDDIIFGSTKKELCNAFKKLMHENFHMSSIGELTFFLGLQVQQKKDGIFISQYKYVVEILKKFRFTDVKTASTLMETQKPLLKDEDGEEVDVHMYKSMIGSLMYLTSSRPNIMFAVCACARYQVNLNVSHLHAVKWIFRYAVWNGIGVNAGDSKFDTSAGNPVKEILLKLNLPDHSSILTDLKMEVKRRSVKVKELQERFTFKAFQVYKSRKVLKITYSHTSQAKGTSSSLKSMITTPYSQEKEKKKKSASTRFKTQHEKGMMLMLAPKSAKALLKSNLLIEQGRIKLPRSFSFGGSWSFINLGYSSDCLISLRKGRFDLIFFRLSMVLWINASSSIIATTASNTPACRSIMPFWRMISHGLNHCESLGRSYPGDRSLRIERLTVHSAQTFIKDFYLLMTIDILLCGLGRSAIPLDKGLYEEIPANNAEDPIDVIVSILVLVLEESVFPQFAHELTHDFEIDIASDFGFKHARCLVFS
ncbi:uncharacterized mitochondrial protein-like protein [Tanacetum coccineum]